MARMSLFVFCLLVTVLQVRAQINCYPNSLCGADAQAPSNAASSSECCLTDLTVTKSYAPSANPSACQPCIVIGFNLKTIAFEESVQSEREIDVQILTPAPEFPPEVRFGELLFNVEVDSNSNADIGHDFKLEGSVSDSAEYSGRIATLPISVNVEILADLIPGEVESFELKITNPTLTDASSGQPLEVLAGNSVTVDIVDDDVLEVQFVDTEFSADESDKAKNITFVISNPIIETTYFYVLPLTYQDYVDNYTILNEANPGLDHFTLTNEYDQAEREDFVQGKVYFSIPANTTTPNQPVTIHLYDDDLLEPVEEGFRLILMVDEEKTNRNLVSFGRKLALFRIDDREDSITFGFVNPEEYLTDTVGTHDVPLLLNVTHGETEIPFDLSFTIGDGTNATEGIDFLAFGKVEIHPPNIFQPGNIFEVTVVGDDIFEGDEKIVVNFDRPLRLQLPEPFKSDIPVPASPPNSVVIPPPDRSINVFLDSTTIFILEGADTRQLTVTLTVPEVIQEGDEFYPKLTVSHEVNATFYVSSKAGTANTGEDFVSFSQEVEFGPSSLSRETVVPVRVTSDSLLEPNETFSIDVDLSSNELPRDLVTFITPTQPITIIDTNSATIGFKRTTVSVNESDKEVNLIVASKGDQLANTTEVVVRVSTSSGTATTDSDFTPVDKNVTITGTDPEKAVKIFVVDDTEYEPDETFTVNLEYISSNVNALIEPPTATVTILASDEPLGKVCTLFSNLTLQTFSNVRETGQSIDTSVGCERKLVTSCDTNLDLEIRVDFLKNDFATTKVAIIYNGDIVTIDENMNLTTSDSPSDIVNYTAMDMVSIEIPGINLTVTKSNTDLTISTEDTVLDLAGLCGGLDGQLYYTDCSMAVITGNNFESFIQHYKVKPSDLVLGGQRDVCGATANDTVIGDPLMTVPINAPEFGDDLNLCYEIHGAADKYFNLVSDGCTSVNAHYVKPSGDVDINFIDSISVVAVDNNNACHEISVNASSCSPVVNGNVGMVMNGNGDPAKRKRHVKIHLEEAGVSVRSDHSWVRISVPNCADNSLVMWVFCHNQRLYDYSTNKMTEPVDMIKFEITRGLNLRETSHGLLGQFWNIPINVTQYDGDLVYTGISPDKFYAVEVNPPKSDARSFVGYMHNVTWEWKPKKCLYVGDRQGGPAGEVLDDDSVIEGSYEDYIIDRPFDTDFIYDAFDHVCP